MIEIRNLTKKYSDLTAVNSINIDVSPGEIFGFLGMNGAGKTTTIKMMTGILRPSSGTIKICGHDIVKDGREAKSVTGYIPDRPHLYNKLTGREFLYFVAELYALPHKSYETRIDEVIEEYSLSSWQDELIESYSHGMKQRLATCAALLHNPRVLILDEPMVGLDPHGAKLLKDAMRRYAQAGMTIFLSTHSLNVAEEVADRLAIIHKGSILTVGSLDDIKNQNGASHYNLEEIFLELTSGAVI